MVDFITNIDVSILNFIREFLSCKVLDVIFSFITSLGDNGIIWLCCAAVLLFFKKYRRYGIVLLIALAIELLICNGILKNVFSRTRPYDFVQGIDLIIKKPGNFSFPSGHTMSSAVAATVLTMTNKKFGYFAIPLATLIAFSRLYLYVHYPSDVIAAAILGILLGIVVFKLQEKIKIRRN